MWRWLELEEQAGRYWHQLTGKIADSYPEFPAAAVTLESTHTALSVFFRGLGGSSTLPLISGLLQTSHHRLSWVQRLKYDQQKLPLATLNSERLLLPATISFFPQKSLNQQLFFWLAAFFAQTDKRDTPFPDDVFQADLCFLHRAYWTSFNICQQYPGLATIHQDLCRGVLDSRAYRDLPAQERTIEAIIQALLGKPCMDRADRELLAHIQQPTLDLNGLRATKSYQTFFPVPLWGVIERDSAKHSAPSPADTDPVRANQPTEPHDQRSRRAQRGKFDQSERDDPLLLNRFEKIITWAEMINVNRAVEDEDEESAREVAESMDELAIAPHQRRASTVLKFDLDLSPQDTNPANILAELTYPEWNYRRKQYHAAHCRVLCQDASTHGESWEPDAKARQQFRRLRRQFEALRPRREISRRQLDGAELDLDALVQAQSDQAASGECSDRLYLASRERARDLAVIILVDISLSTDSWINNRRILDIEKEALIALATGMAACGDTFSIYTFTSRKRDFVQLMTIKAFESPFSGKTLQKIAALRPSYYTRMGAALRHVSHLLQARPERHRLILLLSDGKPNDLDHYEGRYGIEDTRQAVLEARRFGLKLFGITIDHEAKDYFPYLFGQGGYSIVYRPERLIEIVPALYRQLIS